MIKKSGLLLLLSGVTLLVCSGCNLIGAKKTETEYQPTVTVNRPPYVHTVKYPGETLPIISKWYTGDENNWEALADANPYMDYEKMSAGDRLFIPENLLKTAEPLSEEFIIGFNQKSKPVEEIKPVVKEEEKKVPVSKPKPKPKKDEDFDLIGPK
ncbi:MAG: LysM peptidoglycan-binding domain-containing protein [Deltaproteobacteria bacterium]|nr:LysM peptidoglycan-binding domain-containing protein [Deltaproteobacteria bacterium]